MSDLLRESYRFCDDLSRREAKNFYYSFRLLPPDRRRSMTALYAFLRHTDDLADEPAPVATKRKAIDAWRLALDDALRGHPADWPGFPALADTVGRHGMPQKHLVDVIDGVEMDLSQSSYTTFDELYRYCYRVASAVGLSCLHIWGFDSHGGEAERLAESTGIALQLTNILRDVRPDARSGRIYLPEEDLDRFGVSSKSLAEGPMTPELRELFAFQADRAKCYYDRSLPLSALVDPVGRPVLGTISGIYRALLDEIIRRDYNVIDGRVSLSTWRKASIAWRAWRGRSVRPASFPQSAPVPDDARSPRC